MPSGLVLPDAQEVTRATVEFLTRVALSSPVLFFYWLNVVSFRND